MLNWFGDWSTEALYQVGKEFTSKMDLEKPNYVVPDYMPVVYDKLPQPPSHREAIVNSCVFVHQTLHQVGAAALSTHRAASPSALTWSVDMDAELLVDITALVQKEGSRLTVTLLFSDMSPLFPVQSPPCPRFHLCRAVPSLLLPCSGQGLAVNPVEMQAGTSRACF